MTNSYYAFVDRFVPGTKVRADAANFQFDALENAFDLLPTNPASVPLGINTVGVESGSGNLYVVTMPNTRLTNQDKDEVVFKATHTSTGASTLQVDAISAVPLKRFDGSPIQAGDIVSGQYYGTRFDSTGTQFLVVYPTLITSVGALTYASPTALAGLVAIPGVAVTVMRSDAAPAINQTITPTWTNTHTFSANTIFGSSATFGGVVSVADGTVALPGVAFAADPDSGVYRIGANNWAASVGGVKVLDLAAAALSFGSAATNPTYTFLGTGATVFGGAVTVTGVTTFTGAVGATTFSGAVGAANGTVSLPGISFASDLDNGLYRIGANNWGLSAGGVKVVDIAATAVSTAVANVVIGAPTAGIALTVNNNSAGAAVTSAITSPFSSISTSPLLSLKSTAVGGFATLSISGNGTIGTNDLSIFQNGSTFDSTVINRANNANLTLQTTGSGAVNVAAATGGFTVNSLNMTPIYTSFSLGLSGFTGAVSGTVFYRKVGATVTLFAAGVAITGTSNSGIMQSTVAIPAALWPAADQDIPCQLFDNGVGVLGSMYISSTGFLTFTLSKVSGAFVATGQGFTAAGTKGLPVGWSVSFAI